MSRDTPVVPFTVSPCSALEWGTVTAARANSLADGLPLNLMSVLQATAHVRCEPSLLSLAGRAQRYPSGGVPRSRFFNSMKENCND